MLHIGSELGTNQIVSTMLVIGRPAGHHVERDRETRRICPIGTRAVKGQPRVETNLPRFEYTSRFYPSPVTLRKPFLRSV